MNNSPEKSGDDTIYFSCPECGEKFELPKESVGDKARCSNCQLKFIIPESGNSPERIIEESIQVEKKEKQRVAPVTKKSIPPVAYILLLFLIGGGLAFFFINQKKKSTPKQRMLILNEDKLPGKTESTPTIVEKKTVQPEKTKDYKPEIKQVQSSLPAGRVPIDTVLNKDTVTSSKKVKEKNNFNLDKWKKKYIKPDLKAWQNRNPSPWRSYQNATDPKCAETWYTNLGPIGVRTYMHDNAWKGKSAFKAIFPKVLSDNQDLLVNCFEVLDVKKGGPAEGYLKKGDLIFEIEGEKLKTAEILVRSLEPHAGMLIDRAEGRGKIKLKIIRPPAWKRVFVSKILKKGNLTQKIKINVSKASRIRLTVKAAGKSKDYTVLNWINPIFRGKSVTKKLVDLEWNAAISGWKSVNKGKSVEGKKVLFDGDEISNAIGTHANSVIEYDIPKGSSTFSAVAQLAVDKNRDGVICEIELQPKMSVINPKKEWRIVASKKFMNKSDKKEPLNFTVPLKGQEKFALYADSCGGNGSDHLSFENVQIKNAKGEVKRLDELVKLLSQNGYGRVDIDKKKNIWKIHAKCRFEFMVPPGTWTLTGTIKPGGRATIEAKVETIVKGRISKAIAKYIKTVEFDIPQLGSFGPVFDPNSEKTKNVSKLMAAALASYQMPDGGWPKAPSYTTRGFHTAMCGLALMSTGDPIYKENIRKAAYYIANGCDITTDWNYPRGTMLIFLGEYYLRTRDKKILTALKFAVKKVKEGILADYTSGHKISGPGYGGCGWIGPGSNIACGLALADKCGVLNEKDKIVLDKMLERAQQLAPNGQIPYGRVGNRTTKIVKNHAGSCMTGGYLSAALIRGGVEKFAKTVIKRYSTGPYRFSDGGHATQTMHFTWSGIITANCGYQAHVDNMSAFLWKFMTYREMDGLANKNNAAVEFHNGDGVIGEPFWRSAGFIILLNGLKHNLAITGQRNLLANSLVKMPLVYCPDKRVQNYILRNWYLAESLFGTAPPKVFSDTLNAMIKIPASTKLGKTLMGLLNSRLPAVAKSIQILPELSKEKKSMIIRLISGIIFEPSFTKLKTTSKYTLSIKAVSIVDRFKKIFDKDDSYSNLETKGSFVISAKKRSNLPQSLTAKFTTNPKKGEHNSGSCEVRMAGEKPKVNFNVSFKYKIAGAEISYTAPLDFPLPENRGFIPNMLSVKVKGTLITDYFKGKAALSIMLDSGRVLGCETHNMPPPVVYVLAGTPCEFTLSPDSIWALRVIDIKKLEEKYRFAGKSKITLADNMYSGSLDALTDFDPSTYITFKKSMKTCTLELDFEKPITVSSVYSNITQPGWWIQNELVVEAYVNGKWKQIGVGNSTILNPIVITTSKKFRVTFKSNNLKDRQLKELHFNLALPADLKKKFNRATW